MTPDRRTKVVAFDIDDTLYLERDYARSGFSAVGEWAKHDLGVGGLGDAAWELFEQGHRGTVYDEVLARAGVRADRGLVDRMVEVYRTHQPEIALLPDAAAALHWTSSTMAVAVVTDGPLESQRAKVDALGLTAFADPVLLTAALGSHRHKPDPTAFQLIEERLDATGAACAYVGDNPAKDLRGPKSLGWQTIRVRRPGGLHERVPSGPDVDTEVVDLSNLADVLA